MLNLTYKKNKKLHLKEKLLDITIAKTKGNQVSAQWAGVSTKSIRNWIKAEKDIKNANNLCKTILHPGRKAKYDLIEEKLYDFVCFNKDLGNPVTTWSLVLEFIRLNNNEEDNDNIKKFQNRIYRFYKRYRLTMRKPTHVSRAIYKETKLTLYLYISEVFELRKFYHFYDDLICNIDETPLVFSLVPNKVVSMKGAKSVIVKTLGQEKVHCNILLVILSNGNRLPPEIVFKGNKEGKLSVSYRSDDYLKNKKALICFNENDWLTADNMLQ